MRVAVLDDYQDVARRRDPGPRSGRTPRSRSSPTTWPTTTRSSPRLEPFDVVVAMRERTPFPERVARAAAAACACSSPPGWATRRSTWTPREPTASSSAARTGCASPTAELTWALILALRAASPPRTRAVRAGGWQTTIGPELSGRTLGVLGPRPPRDARSPASAGRSTCASSPGAQNLDRGARPREAGAERVEQGRAVRARRRGHDPPAAQRPHARAGRARPSWRSDRPTATWSTPRAGRSSTRRRCWPRCATARSPAPRLDVFDTEPLPRRPPAAHGAEHRAHAAHRLRDARGPTRCSSRDAVEDIEAWRPRRAGTRPDLRLRPRWRARAATRPAAAAAPAPAARPPWRRSPTASPR